MVLFFQLAELRQHYNSDVSRGDRSIREVVAPETRVERPGHTVPVCDPVRSVHGKLSDSSTIVAHGGSNGARLGEVEMISGECKAQEMVS